MSFGVVVIAHNEEEFIEAQIRQWGDTPVLVLVSKKSWNNDIPQNDATSDILNALVALGYSDKEAMLALKQVPAGAGVSDGIKLALKALSKG